MKIHKTIRLPLIIALLVFSSLCASSWGVLAAGISQAPLAPGNPVIDPAANDHTVPVTSTVSITYDEDIDPNTVNTQTFAVQAMQTGLLTETFSINGGEITLTPNASFKPGELVQVSATTGTLGLPSGEGPAEPTVWQFRTAVGGDGTGAMMPHPTTPEFGGGSSQDNALGDLDGDGDLDTVIANGGAYNTDEVWVNDGSGNFTPHPTTPLFGADHSSGVALGDLDSDGDLDAVISNRYDAPETVWLNDGSGNFTPHPTTPTFGADDSHNVVLGDIDGDGDLDTLISNYDGLQTVWLNDGLGNFSPHPNTPGFDSSGYAREVVLGDLDADGDLDAVVTKRYNRPNTVWLNDGQGNFSAHPSTPTFGGGDSYAVVLGDLDGDGDLDAVVGNRNDEAETVWLNDGSGNFSAHPTTPSFGADYTYNLDLGDLDADGDLDIIVSNGGNGIGQPETIWLNDGAGNFSPHPTSPAIGDRINSAARFGDLDRDGDLDILVSHSGLAAQTVWLNELFANLEIVKDVTPSQSLLPGELITYTLSFANLGPKTATNITITDEIPVELTQVGYVSSLPITPTGTTSYTWLIPDLAFGENGVITITGIIDPNLSNVLTFTNTAAITSTTLEYPTSNNTSSVITEINLPPIAGDDSGNDYTTDENTSFTTGNVLTNDFDPNGEVLSIASYNDSGLLGILTPNSDGSFDYNPNGQFVGLVSGESAFDIFTYTVSDGVLTDTAVVTITINGIDSPPVAIDDSGVEYTTDEDTAFVTGNILGNDYHPEGKPISISNYDDSGLLGILTPNGDGTFDYDPDGQFEGLLPGEETYDLFTYTISDGIFTDTATVTITITGVNDNPVVDAGPNQSTEEGDEVQFQGNADDPGLRWPDEITVIHWDFGDGNSATGTLTPTHIYVDDAVYTVTLTVTDTLGSSASDWLLVTVENVSPTLSTFANQEVDIGQAITITGTITDPGLLDSQTVEITWAYGVTDTLQLEAHERQFSATHTYTQPGEYTVTVRVIDKDGAWDEKTFSVTVNNYAIYLPLTSK